MSRIAQKVSLEVDLTEFLSDPDALYEIVDGEVVELESMGTVAILIANNFLVALLAFLKPRKLGRAALEAIFILDAARPLERRPDVAFVSHERWPIQTDVPEGDWNVIPDLVIEVISPRDTDRAIQRKLREYFDAGVRQVWHVRPLDESITIYDSLRSVRILGSDDQIDGGDVLPGFQIPIAPLFRRTED